jgi:hypothetical protein
MHGANMKILKDPLNDAVSEAGSSSVSSDDAPKWQ